MRRRAFSIVEVMFAIMILGIGFIMVAAIFPVAIQQSQANVDESTGQTVAMSGAIQTAVAFHQATLTDIDTVNGVAEFRRIGELPAAAAAAQEMINSSTILQADNRFGWTSFYQHKPMAGSRSFNLITVALRTRNNPEQLSLADAIGFSGYPGASWQIGDKGYDNASIQCQVDFNAVVGMPGRVRVIAIGTNGPQALQAMVEGAILIVRNHMDQGTVGRVYYVGSYFDSDEWDLDPRSDAIPVTSNTNVQVLLLGRGLRYPNDSWGLTTILVPSRENPREGASQVVGMCRMTSALP